VIAKMKRREFITLLGGAVAWPFAAQAQQPGRMQRVGVLAPIHAEEPESKARISTFVLRLRELGWVDGSNVEIVYRWSGGNVADTRKYAAELAALAPDVILTFGSLGAGALLQATRTVPAVFAMVPDPVGSGFVKSLSRPGGNTTGFMMFEYSLCAKWLELLKEIAPSVTRAAVLWDPNLTAGIGQFAVIQSAASSVRVEVSPVNINDAAEIESTVAAFASSANGGLISTASALSLIHRDLIIRLAAQYKLPAVYQERSYVAAGGLTSYGPNFLDQFRRAAGYVDRILKGEKPGDLPVQAPTKYYLVINLKAARAVGLTINRDILLVADEVIE
jgi:putative ABC transport system substrate-binding protein